MSSEMLIKDYANAVKKSFTSTVSQGRFMRDVFKAAGYDRFPSSSDEDYAKKICNGSKPITDEMRSGFPKPYHVDDLADYYIKNAAGDKLRTLANTFGLTDRQLNSELLYKAAAAQFFLYVENGGADKPESNAVAEKYGRLVAGTIDESILQMPLHSGDKAWVINGQRVRSYTKGFYEKFEHVWRIRNNGNVPWKDRQLICKSQKTQQIKVDNERLIVPDTKPGDTAEVSIMVDSRGKEGTYISVWEMIDAEGNNCFPDDSKEFNFEVTVRNASRGTTEAE